jgi:hypothetical protein
MEGTGKGRGTHHIPDCIRKEREVEEIGKKKENGKKKRNAKSKKESESKREGGGGGEREEREERKRKNHHHHHDCLSRRVAPKRTTLRTQVALITYHEFRPQAFSASSFCCSPRSS